MRVGSDIGGICGRCGDVWHVVVAVVDGRIAKVECKQCGARHRHRPADDEPRRGAARQASRTRKPGRASKPVVDADPSRPRRPFRATDTYAVGDRIVHPSFGEGVVQALRGPTKVEVLFEAGPKVLVHGRG